MNEMFNFACYNFYFINFGLLTSGLLFGNPIHAHQTFASIFKNLTTSNIILPFFAQIFPVSGLLFENKNQHFANNRDRVRVMVRYLLKEAK